MKKRCLLITVPLCMEKVLISLLLVLAGLFLTCRTAVAGHQDQHLHCYVSLIFVSIVTVTGWILTTFFQVQVCCSALQSQMLFFFLFCPLHDWKVDTLFFLSGPSGFSGILVRSADINQIPPRVVMNLHGYDIRNHFKNQVKNPINHVINLHKDLNNSQNLYFLIFFFFADACVN